jgi:hypothetical protein
MPVVKAKPSKAHPLPYTGVDEELGSFVAELETAANTAELLEKLGAPLEVDPTTFDREKSLLDAVVKTQARGPLGHYPTALAAGTFLRQYGQALAFDAAQVRAALTNKLLEIANCGETKFELKALELLGKHSDIGLFTERSEITINYNSPDALESAIKERVKRLLNADIIDVEPLGADLDEELGVYAREEPAPDEEPGEEAEEAPEKENEDD